jgi:hypothetical protein
VSFLPRQAERSKASDDPALEALARTARVLRHLLALDTQTPYRRLEIQRQFRAVCRLADAAGVNLWTVCQLLADDPATWPELLATLGKIDEDQEPLSIGVIFAGEPVLFDHRAAIRMRPFSAAGPPPQNESAPLRARR